MRSCTYERLLVLLLVGWVGLVVAPPPRVKPPAPPPHPKDPMDESAMQELEYQRYLQEVVNVLEAHPEFKKKLEEMDPEDVKAGKIADHLEDFPTDMRNQLNEIKNKEITRLREALRKQIEINGPQGIQMPEHIDHSNLGSFEKDDLRKLISKTTKDLDDLDKKRKQEFKRYEMKKELEKKRKLAKLPPEEREKAKAEMEAAEKAHKDHPKLKHPGSKAQLEEVWDEVDDLEGQEFDPVTFFNLHDTTGDGYWDDGEVEALFQKELEKVYNESDSNDDMNEKFEEMYRMREHLVNEIDKNQDGVISKDEFLESTKTKDFDKDEGWDGIEDQDMFSDDELQNFQKEMGFQYPDYGQAAYPTPQHQQQGGQYPQGGQQQQQQYPQGGHPNQYPQGGQPQQQQYPQGGQQQQYPPQGGQQQYPPQGGQQQYPPQGGHPDQMGGGPPPQMCVPPQGGIPPQQFQAQHQQQAQQHQQQGGVPPQQGGIPPESNQQHNDPNAPPQQNHGAA